MRPSRCTIFWWVTFWNSSLSESSDAPKILAAVNCATASEETFPTEMIGITCCKKSVLMSFRKPSHIWCAGEDEDEDSEAATDLDVEIVSRDEDEDDVVRQEHVPRMTAPRGVRGGDRSDDGHTFSSWSRPLRRPYRRGRAPCSVLS